MAKKVELSKGHMDAMFQTRSVTVTTEDGDEIEIVPPSGWMP